MGNIKIEYIMCIGEDDKQHVCKPHEDKTECGVKVKRKKLLKNDHKKYGCYPCTY